MFAQLFQNNAAHMTNNKRQLCYFLLILVDVLIAITVCNVMARASLSQSCFQSPHCFPYICIVFFILVMLFIKNDSLLKIQVTIGEGSHPENVKVYGPGVEKTGLKANEPTYFTVDCSEAGQGGPACFTSNATVYSKMR